jgi:hypothetical protein
VSSDTLSVIDAQLSRTGQPSVGDFETRAAPM